MQFQIDRIFKKIKHFLVENIKKVNFLKIYNKYIINLLNYQLIKNVQNTNGWTAK